MYKITNKITSGLATIMHSLVIPVFALVFTIYYRPFGTETLLELGGKTFTFNATILFCIILVSTTITRCWLFLIGKFKNITVPAYLLWSFAEILVASLFCSLYIVLISGGELLYFEVAGMCYVTMLAVCVYPYGFLWLSFELYTRNTEEPHPVDDSSLLRFYDEYKKLKLVIAPEAVMYIKSEENYVQIHYLDNNRSRKFSLRSSMRALENELSKFGLVRCHRSYFINPRFIKIVHRDPAGLIVAELKQDGHESIPVSRKYHDSIIRLL